MCTLLELVGGSRAFFAVCDVGWQGKGSNNASGPEILRWISKFLTTEVFFPEVFSFLSYVLLFGTVFVECIHMHKMLLYMCYCICFSRFAKCVFFQICILKFYKLLSQKTKTSVFNLMLESLDQEIDGFYELSTFVHIK